jgi:hypothetical protein
MKFVNRSLFLGMMVALAASTAQAGDIVDKIVANVNGHVLLKSDWDEEMAFEAFLNGRAPDSISTAERNAALERLIDQELLREQVQPKQAAPADAVGVRLGEVRKMYPDAAGEEGWRATIARYGLTEGTLQKRLGDDIELMRLVEAHLRPSIQIDAHAVENYYREQFLPELRKTGSKEVPLPEVSARIKSVLAEQKMNHLIASWLESLRSESRISTAGGGDRNR